MASYVSCRKVLPSGECIHSVCPAHMQQHLPVPDPWYIHTCYYYLPLHPDWVPPTSAFSLSLSGACHKDVAASMSRCHAGLSTVHHHAVARPKLSGCRSSSTVLSQICLGLPVLRRQSLGGLRMQARRAREWSCRSWHGTDDQRRTSAVDG